MTPEQHTELMESMGRLRASLAEMARNLNHLGKSLEVKIRGDQLVYAIRRDQKRRGKPEID